MPSWSKILNEVSNEKSGYDRVRLRYLDNLQKYTGRTTIAYYSSWLNKSNSDNLDINDYDMTGFMNCLCGIKKTDGLDLILHTPGGSPVAAEAIVNYLRSMFNKDIRVIVPQLALSAGTMIACSAKEIIIGKQSSLGPIDPQVYGYSAFNIKKDFELAKKEISKDPSKVNFWALKFNQLPATIANDALDAIELSDILANDWLGTCMFDSTKKEDTKIIKNIVSNINEHDKSKFHGRHFNFDFCKDIGLNVIRLEDDQELQERVLSLHHSYMITMDLSPAVKLIESPGSEGYVSF